MTLPLQGYFHPGKYMPVHVVASPRTAAEDYVRVASPGAVWTAVKLDGGRVDVTVPLLPIDERARELSWSRATPIRPLLHPLADRQRIVVFAGVESRAALDVAERIYPGDELIPIALSPGEPLAGTHAAWETVDVVVLDGAAARRVGEPRFAALVALGVAFAIHEGGAGGGPAPWPRWPWRRDAEGWAIMHYAPAGPTAVNYDPSVYEPVAGWRAGWPTEARRQMLLMAAAFVIPMLLLALWRPRWTGLWALLLSGACVGGLALWGNWRGPKLTIVGNVKVVGPSITQDDDWCYQISHLRTYSLIHWVDVMKPMFASPNQLDFSDARIVCFPNGDPDFLFFNLAAKDTMAILARRCGPQGPSVAPSPKVTSPLAEMVRKLYLRSPGDRIVGELSSPPIVGEPYLTSTQWPGVVVKAEARSTRSEANPKAE